MNKKIIKAEEGSALVLVMMVLLVLSVLGAALGVTTMGSLNLSENNQDSNSAYYIAQAGANMAYEEIKVEVDNAYEQAKQTESERSFFNYINGKLSPRTYTDPYFKSTTTSQSKAEVKIVQLGEDTEKESTYKYMIQSTGNVNGKTLTVEKPVDITWKSHGIGEEEQKIWTPDAALIFKDYVSAPLSYLEVHGDIVYDLNAVNPFQGGFSIIRQPARRIVGYNWLGFPITERTNYKRERKNLNWGKYDEIIERFPKRPPDYDEELNPSRLITNVTINENTYIPNLKSSLFSNIIINTNDKDIDILVDYLELSGGINIEVLGSGTVNFYVRRDMKLSGIGVINRRKSESQINFLYEGDHTVLFNGGFSLNASVFVKKADIAINGASIVTDGIISGGKRISLAGGHSIGGMIYAPYANVKVTGGATIDGIVLAESLELSGLSAASINYNGEYIDDFYYYEEVKEDSTIDDLISSEPALEQ